MSKAAYPWEGGKSLFEYIQDRIQEGNLRYSGRQALPDDDDGSGFLLAAGGRDGIAIFHERPPDQTGEPAQTIGKLLLRQTQEPCEENRQALYMALVEPQAVKYADALRSYLKSQQEHLNIQNLYAEATWLLWNASHREPLKIAIEILGIFGMPDLCEIFRRIGKHDEFTLFAYIALTNSSEDVERDMMDFASFSRGWGKIQVVSRMTGDSERSRKWLIQEGCRNDIADNYLAFHCATTGNLPEVVSRRSINEKTYFGVQTILLALLDFDGPMADIDDYEHAPQVIRQFMRHAKRHAYQWVDFFALVKIRDFLQQPDEMWLPRYQRGWTRRQRNESLLVCGNILRDEKWLERIPRDLYYDNVRSDVLVEVYRAGKILGVDLWDRLLRRLTETPDDDQVLLAAIQTDDPNRLQKVADLLLESGRLHRLLENEPFDFGSISVLFMLQKLAGYVGIGFELVWVVLTQSSNEKTRGRAARVLDEWAQNGLTQELRQLIKERLLTIRNPEDRESVRQLL